MSEAHTPPNKKPPTRWFFYLIESVIRTVFARWGYPYQGATLLSLRTFPLSGKSPVLSAKK